MGNCYKLSNLFPAYKHQWIHCMYPPDLYPKHHKLQPAPLRWICASFHCPPLTLESDIWQIIFQTLFEYKELNLLSVIIWKIVLCFYINISTTNMKRAQQQPAFALSVYWQSLFQLLLLLTIETKFWTRTIKIKSLSKYCIFMTKGASEAFLFTRPLRYLTKIGLKHQLLVGKLV